MTGDLLLRWVDGHIIEFLSIRELAHPDSELLTLCLGGHHGYRTGEQYFFRSARVTHSEPPEEWKEER